MELSGGTLFANGITLVKDNTIANAYGTLTMSGTATAYLGPIGLVGNPGAGGSGYFVTLTGGTIGATTDYTNNANMTLSGGITVQAADVAGAPHYVYANGVWSGSGSVTKTGNGTLVLDAAETYSGATVINAGTLALGVNGSLAGSPVIVGNGATFDESAVTGGYILAAGKTLGGSGVVTGAVVVAAGGIINPGSNALTSGVLSFSNSVTETGLATNHFELSATPGPNNDAITIAGNFSVSGLNTIEISGGAVGQTYPLIRYGSLTGDLSNFALSAIGVLSNSVAAKTIFFTSLNTTRAATNIVWVGNANLLNNNWDLTISTNWLKGAVLDYFVPRDNARFDGRGATNSLVNLIGNLTAGSVTVDTGVSNYVFTGTGSISEQLGFPASLTKTNAGTLTILTTNNYTGITTVNGGVLEVAQLDNGGAGSGIGAASSDPANLLIGNATLRYTGANGSSDRGATFNGTNGILDITNSATTLTLSGTLTGGGTLTKIGAGTVIVSGVNSHGASTAAAGTLQVNSTNLAIGSGPVNFTGGTLRMNVSGQPTFANALNVLATSTLISAGGNNNIIQGPWSGAGLLNLDIASGTFTINGNMTTNFTGTILMSASSAGFFRLNGGGNGNGAQQTTGSTQATFDLGNSTVTLLNRNGGAAAFGVYNLGALSGGSGTTIRGASNGGGAINACAYSIGAKNLNTTFAGTIANGTGGAGATTGVNKVGTGVLTLTGNNSYTGNTVVSNGVLALGDGVTDGSIGSSANITINAGTVLDVSGRTDKKLSLNSGQTLGGNGSVFGDVDSAAGSTVSPGASIGTLTVTNIATLGGDLYVELNRTNGAQTNDILKAASIVLGGSLTVTNVGPNLVAGDRFVLFNGPVSGAFATVNLPENLGSVTYTWTNKTAIDGSIRVLTVVTVNTNPTNIVTSVSGSTLTLSWPADHTGWRLQSQTNDINTGLTGAWTDVPGTAASNTYNAAIDPANGTVFYRLVYP